VQTAAFADFAAAMGVDRAPAEHAAQAVLDLVAERAPRRS
jgi:hypothetical protein